MELEWNLQKAADNLRKHGVDFADAAIALEDDNALTIEDKDHDEQRFKTLGMGPNLNILYVVHTERENNSIRIISARKAERSEIKQYYQGNAVHLRCYMIFVGSNLFERGVNINLYGHFSSLRANEFAPTNS